MLGALYELVMWGMQDRGHSDVASGRWRRQPQSRGIGSKGSAKELGIDVEAQEVALFEVQTELERERAAGEALRQELLCVSVLESAVYLRFVKSQKGPLLIIDIVVSA